MTKTTLDVLPVPGRDWLRWLEQNLPWVIGIGLTTLGVVNQVPLWPVGFASFIVLWTFVLWLMRRSMPPPPGHVRPISKPFLLGVCATLGTGLALYWAYAFDPILGATTGDTLWLAFLFPMLFACRYCTPRQYAVIWALVLLHPVLRLSLEERPINPAHVSQTVWLTLIGVIFLFVMQRWLSSIAQVQILRTILTDLAGQLGFSQPSDLDQLSKMIAEYGYPLIHIMVVDPKNRTLYVKGAYGKPKEVWSNVRLGLDKGITGRAVRTQEPQLCRDVTDPRWRDIYVAFPGYERIRSELSVPIIAGRRVYGVVDIQSERVNYFDEEDLTILQGFAAAATIALDRDFLVDLSKVVSRQVTRGPLSILQAACESIFDHFKADLITAYVLTPETGGVPRRPVITVGTPNGREVVGDKHPTRAGCLGELIRRWELHPFPDLDRSNMFSNFDDSWELESFLKREGVRSAVFAPVGSKTFKVGVIFLSFREYTVLTRRDKRLIRCATDLVGAAMTQAHRDQQALPRWLNRTLVERGQNAHQLLIPYSSAAIRSLECAESSLIEKDCLSNSAVRLAVNEITNARETIEELRRELTLALIGSGVDLSNKRLETALGAAVTSLQALHNGRNHGRGLSITIRVDPAVDEECSAMREAIHRFTVEAIVNAVKHGEASSVVVDIEREHDQTIISVINNGKSYEPKRALASPYGIISYGHKLEHELGAEFRISPGPDTEGTEVLLMIPMIISQKEADP